MQSLLRFTKKHPWLTNVTIYGSLFSCADVAQQLLTKDPGDAVCFRQTAKVGLVGFCFHANFNFFWLRFIERVFPGSAPRNVIRKVMCDQLFAGPVTISVFYTGLSFLDGKEDVFKDLREKFWPTYKSGVLCWTLIQTVNFSLVPPFIRTIYIGLCAFLWTTFLCYLRNRDIEQVTSQLLASLPFMGSQRRPGSEGSDNR
ncbi:mpv17-like protein [Microcaecilia unicolor]|uniref:Mpv17-like protein n=1 Tax=Microcaecilia unicolor TaxID=1415580 RepID=A0A6P7XSF4_9AMPH|nr:mpv17-like protein [Microcaecilia unicolor]